MGVHMDELGGIAEDQGKGNVVRLGRIGEAVQWQHGTHIFRHYDAGRVGVGSTHCRNEQGDPRCGRDRRRDTAVEQAGDRWRAHVLLVIFKSLL